jgi:hypothetical protein
MKKGFLYLASVSVLLWLLPDWSLAETPANSHVRPTTDSNSPLALHAREDVGRGNEYYVDCGVTEENGDGRFAHKTSR